MSKERLPDSELKIMMIIWDASSPVTCGYIMERLDKAWVKPTVLNFLNRLSERGFVRIYKEGRHNVYEPLIDKDDYISRESASFLKKMHHSSLKSLVSSLYDGNSITKDDLEDLKSFIEGKNHA